MTGHINGHMIIGIKISKVLNPYVSIKTLSIGIDILILVLPREIFIN